MNLCNIITCGASYAYVRTYLYNLRIKLNLLIKTVFLQKYKRYHSYLKYITPHLLTLIN
jgi:hypothetical protein